MRFIIWNQHATDELWQWTEVDSHEITRDRLKVLTGVNLIDLYELLKINLGLRGVRIEMSKEEKDNG